MKLALLVAISGALLMHAQEKFTDVSPDGKTSVSYARQIKNSGGIVFTSGEIPFGTQPDWRSTLERQIGGLAWGDYDGDGDLDLATGCYFSNSFPPINDYENLIYRNDNGQLTTTPAWVSSDERSTTDIKWGDVNGDGLQDLISINGDGSFAPSVVYFNSPSGLNTSPGWISSSFAWSVGGALTDIDGDGDLDLAIGNQGNTQFPAKPITIFKNSGGTYPVSASWLSSDQMICNSLSFCDINRSSVTPARKSFTTAAGQHVFYLPGVPLYAVDTVLINGARTANFCYDRNSGWLSVGERPAPGSSVVIVYRYERIADMAAAKWVNYQSCVYFNYDSLISAAPDWQTGFTGGQKGVDWGDMDRDGWYDLAYGGSGSAHVVYRNTAGTLGSTPAWSSGSSSTSSQELYWQDLNRDGYPELAVVHFGNLRVDIYLNRNGILDTAPTWSYAPGTSCTSIAFGDLNGDGYPDLALGTARNPVMVFVNKSVLPVQLASFSAEDAGSMHILRWRTATEVNCKLFTVETKMGSEWVPLGELAGSGTTTSPRSYTYYNPAPLPGINHYRLAQRDFDGTVHYSTTVTAGEPVPEAFRITSPYPNPFNPQCTIQCIVPSDGLVAWDLLDVTGSSLRHEERYVPAGSRNITVDGASLPSGVYVLVIQWHANSGTVVNRYARVTLIK